MEEEEVQWPETHEFSAEKVAELLHQERYSECCSVLVYALDTFRSSVAVNWCQVYGFRRGHVPVLYYFIRNVLKHRVGRVPSTDDLTITMRAVALLLMRTAQDTRAASIDMAKDVSVVYPLLRDKLCAWLQAWNATDLPSVKTVIPFLETWHAANTDSLPLPTWVTSLRCSMLGYTLTWGDPTAHDSAAFKRNQGMRATRADTAVAFLTFLARTPDTFTWMQLLHVDMSDILA